MFFTSGLITVMYFLWGGSAFRLEHIIHQIHFRKPSVIILGPRGMSVFAGLIAFLLNSFLSGLVVPETRGNETVPEVVTTSGYALLHFFSDAAYNLTGFSIAYS